MRFLILSVAILMLGLMVSSCLERVEQPNKARLD